MNEVRGQAPLSLHRNRNPGTRDVRRCLAEGAAARMRFACAAARRRTRLIRDCGSS
jgi:hypothetical protein